MKRTVVVMVDMNRMSVDRHDDGDGALSGCCGRSIEFSQPYSATGYTLYWGQWDEKKSR